ncbi:hypothetical protein K469DRAFT_558749, partial [Zopfia rhizophila CBS 207.26]
KKNSNILPPYYKDINYNIKLIAKNILILSLLYSISFKNTRYIEKRYILDKNINRQLILYNKNTMALLTLFILKKNSKLRLCINYRYLNKAIVKNHYLILLILKLIDKLRGAK